MEAFRRTQYREEDDLTEGTDWTDGRTRRHFISKVLVIIGFQMAFTAGCTVGVLFWPLAINMFQKEKYLMYIGAGGMFVGSSVIFCCRRLSRKVPINYFLLFVYTIFTTMMVCSTTVYYQTNLILYAFGTTVLLCICLTIFAMCFPCDFTGYGPFLCVTGFATFAVGILAFVMKDPLVQMIYLGISLILFSLYLVYDIQLMVGRHKNQYCEEDYIIAALSIYSDIIRMFITLLQLIARIRSNN
ncbi:PREDICTED: protein lifeguard 1 isoform X1 [Drosophila arizonae]|uniref:Protein lifeguard 1 isoform X1 n=1 Tax=Drosophila arizonae TaxID=7263 RepID=A0ABM1NTE3_DROAR|nr:PREDICTED: protein lifeguard 1 isoform X1 [Drosophila arizonae]